MALNFPIDEYLAAKKQQFANEAERTDVGYKALAQVLTSATAGYIQGKEKQREYARLDMEAKKKADREFVNKAKEIHLEQLLKGYDIFKKPVPETVTPTAGPINRISNVDKEGFGLPPTFVPPAPVITPAQPEQLLTPDSPAYMDWLQGKTPERFETRQKEGITTLIDPLTGKIVRTIPTPGQKSTVKELQQPHATATGGFSGQFADIRILAQNSTQALQAYKTTRESLDRGEATPEDVQIALNQYRDTKNIYDSTVQKKFGFTLPEYTILVTDDTGLSGLFGGKTKSIVKKEGGKTAEKPPFKGNAVGQTATKDGVTYTWDGKQWK